MRSVFSEAGEAQKRGRGGPGPVLLLVALLSLNLSGCRLIGGSRGPSGPGDQEGLPISDEPMPQGGYSGFFEIEGGRLEGNLTLTPVGGTTLHGVFQSPPDMVAEGRGRFRDGELRLELEYEGDCPGKVNLVGRWQEGPGTLSGGLRASDCTGEAEGTFLFSPEQNSFSSEEG